MNNLVMFLVGFVLPVGILSILVMIDLFILPIEIIGVIIQ